MPKTKVPARLRHSESYRDHPEETQKLWDEGFRPIAARDLKHGMVAASKVTMFGFEMESRIQYVNIEDVVVNETGDPHWEYEVIISHDGMGGVSYEDPDAEVWVKEVENVRNIRD